MTLSSQFFLATLLLASHKVTHKSPVLHPPDPYIVSDAPGFDRCARPPSCPGRLLTVRNPQRDAVAVDIWCRNDPRTMTRTTIPPDALATFDIGTDAPGGMKQGDCTIAKWRAWPPSIELEVLNLSEPHIVSDIAGSDHCVRRPMCPIRMITVKNPLSYPVRVVVWCRDRPERVDPVDEIEFVLPGGRTSSFFMSRATKVDLKRGDCTIRQWRR